MRERSQAHSATNLPAGKVSSARRSRIVQPAPGPETPDELDKAGRQGGMVIVLVGAGLFWLLVIAVVLYLMH